MYNHAFDVAFEVITKNDAENVTAQEWLDALKQRVAFLEANPDELNECVNSCLPFDSYIIEGDNLVSVS